MILHNVKEYCIDIRMIPNNFQIIVLLVYFHYMYNIKLKYILDKL